MVPFSEGNRSDDDIDIGGRSSVGRSINGSIKNIVGPLVGLMDELYEHA